MSLVLLRNSVTATRADMAARQTCLRPHDEALSSYQPTNHCNHDLQLLQLAKWPVANIATLFKTAPSSVCQLALETSLGKSCRSGWKRKRGAHPCTIVPDPSYQKDRGGWHSVAIRHVGDAGHGTQRAVGQAWPST